MASWPLLFAGFCKSGWFGFVIQSVPLVIPQSGSKCGHIGPYSAGSGISTKRSLLISEGGDSEFRFIRRIL